MNDIKLTVELCAEDRARLDKIIEGLAGLGKHPDCSKCVKDVAGMVEKACECIDKAGNTPEKLTITKLKEGDPGYCPHDDEAQKALAEVLSKDKAATPAESPKNAQEEPKATDHPTLDPFPAQPTATEVPSKASVKEVSTAELQQLVIALCRAGKKDKVREVVNAYGVQTVAAIPEDKRTEVYGQLKALEG